jgi:Flp pilus assembly protein TadG
MKRLFQNRDGATALEFALAMLPIMLFIAGIFQTAYILWIDNMLHYSVDAAARCGAIGSTTYPCNGGTLANMQSTANALFAPNPGGSPTFTNNSCSGTGLTGTYQVSILSVTNLTLTAKSCYP